MRFLFVCDFEYNPNSGAGGSLIVIGNALEKEGHEVDYIWRKTNRLIKSNNLYRFIELPLVQFHQIQDYFKKNVEVDVIIASQPHCWFAFRKLKVKYPNILFLNRTHGWELRITPEYFKIKYPNASLLRLWKNKMTLKLLEYCSLKTVEYSDGILCASSDDADFIRKTYPTYKSSVYTIPYGLSPEFIGLKLSQSKDEKKLKFIYVGQYTERKGIKDIVKLFGGIEKSYELTFIINEDALKEAKQDFKRIANVTFHKWMDRANLIDFYLNHDVFLMPSYGEGFGKTNLEAMASGLCVLGYKEGALSDFGIHKKNSLLAKPGHFTQLQNNFEMCFSHPSTVRNYGNQAYKDVQNLTWRNFALTTIKTIQSLKYK